MPTLSTSDLDTPLITVDFDRVESNVRRMQESCDGRGLAFRPHIKTHKLPQIARMQLDAGAVGIACQKVGEAEVMAEAGIGDIMITFPIIGSSKVRRLAGLAKTVSLSTVADSTAGVRGLSAGLAASLAFVALQGVALHAARDIVRTTVARIDPQERLLDTALSAYPANPLCWSFVTVAVDAAHGSYHLRRGQLSVAPAIAQVASCPASIAGRASGGDAQLAWQDERDSVAHLRALQATNCRFNAWMRFARAPSVGAGEATDARWSPIGSRNFSTIDYGEGAAAPCPHPVPGWGYPRADLLGRH